MYSLDAFQQLLLAYFKWENNPTFTPHTDTGDFVIKHITLKVKLTAKATDKIYYTHSNHPGGLKQISAGELALKCKVRLIENQLKVCFHTLWPRFIKELKVFAGAEHTHAAQQPEVLDISDLSKERNNKSMSQYAGTGLP